MSNPYITPDLFSFLQDLKANNTRDWFNENKPRYEQVLKDPLLDFIADFAPLLRSISPHFSAIPKANGGSLFRIYRDVRFSANKAPYKTHAGIHFRHEAGKNAHAPGFYLHLEPGSVFVAAGTWHPEPELLRNIRTTIADFPDEWEAIVREPAFSAEFKLEGDSLKRAPKGFDPEHPLIEDLRRKDFIAVCRLDESQSLRPDFMEMLVDKWTTCSPFARFLAEASRNPF
jgi:uncharacterized protein (TIGR02453 family)